MKHRWIPTATTLLTLCFGLPALEARPGEEVICREGSIPIELTGVGDLDGDAVDDVAMYVPIDPDVDDKSTLTLVSGLTGDLLWQRTGGESFDGFGAEVGALSDLNGDEVPELVIQTVGEVLDGIFRMEIVNGKNGLPIRPFQVAEYGEILVPGDLDGDERFDFCVVGYASSTITAYSGVNGQPIRALGSVLPGETVKLLPDWSRDGAEDLLLEKPDGSFRVLSSKNGLVMYRSTISPHYSGFGGFIGLPDLDDDDIPEFAGRSREGDLAVFSGRNGKIKWIEFDSAFSLIRVGDYDCDQSEDFLTRKLIVAEGSQPHWDVRIWSGVDGRVLHQFIQPEFLSSMPLPLAHLALDNHPHIAYVDTHIGEETSWTCVQRVENRCGGRVTWVSGAPIKGARIEAYYIAKQGSVFLTKPLAPMGGSPVESDEDGYFDLPREYSERPRQRGELRHYSRGLRAIVEYQENTGTGHDNKRLVVNYPDWDPLRPTHTRTTGNETILYPFPVVFQPGVFGQINSGAADRLRDFLIKDAGAERRPYDPRDWVALKRGLYGSTPIRIPSFLFFGMPSTGDSCLDLITWMSDDVAWGYDNCPITANGPKIRANAAALEANITTRVRGELVKLTPDDLEDVDIHLSAHSYGGLISRCYLKTKGTWPNVDKYVSFDAVHGGTRWAPWFLAFSEAFLNGWASHDDVPPQVRGWNYGYSLGDSTDNLLFSASDERLIIHPTATAFGVGRTMRRRLIYLPLIGFVSYYTANGHCGRFLGGWELVVPDTGNLMAGHSIQNIEEVMVSTGRYLAGTGRPTLGSKYQPGRAIASATLSRPPSEYCDGADPDNGPVPRTRLTLEAGARSDSSRPIHVAKAGTLRVAGFSTSQQARITLLDQAGRELAPRAGAEDQVQQDGVLFDLEYDVTPGSLTMLLEAGSVAAAALVEVEHDDGHRAVVGTDSVEYSRSSSVLVSAALFDDNMSILPGGTAEATVLRPDGVQDTFPLLDDGLSGDGAAGDGHFAAQVPMLVGPGRYRLRVSVDGRIASGMPLSRSAESFFTVLSDAAWIVGVSGETLVDEDADGEAEAVRVDYLIQASSPGDFLLAGELLHQGQPVRVLGDRVGFDAAGVATASLTIPADRFHAAGSGVGFQLGAIDLVDETLALQLDTAPDHALSGYALSQFELPAGPQVAAVQPGAGSADGGNTVILHGQHLESPTTVLFGNQPASIVSASRNALVVTAPGSESGGSEEARIRMQTSFGEFSGLLYRYTTSLGGSIDRDILAGDRVDGLLPSGEVHRLRFPAVAGTQVDLTCRRKGKNEMEPLLAVVGPDGSYLIGPDESRVNGKSAALKKLLLTATGDYRIEVSDASGQGGRYLLETRVKYPKTPPGMVAVAPDSRSDVLLFDLIPGSSIKSLSISRVKAKGKWKKIDGVPSRLTPMIESLHAPDGSEIDFLADGKVKARASKFTLSRLAVEQLGSYQVVITGDRDSVGYGKATLRVRYPMPRTTHHLP